jgi:hypothetical protein
MNEPFELLPGRTYVLEHPDILSGKMRDRLLETLYSQTSQLHCRFIILDGGIKLARVKESITEVAVEMTEEARDWLETWEL